ncbi:MAG: glycosyltransferase family 2 protein [Terracidiphilus sp.]
MKVDCTDGIPSKTSGEKLIRVAVLITCFNRRETTLRCLEALFAQDLPGCAVHVFVVDDASTDGTHGAIAERFPQVRLFSGTGDLFWNRGMHMAFGYALAEDFDYYFWLNDDTVLFKSAINLMLKTAKEMRRDGVEPIIVGNTLNPDTKQHSYGGIVKARGIGQRAFRLAQPNPDHAEACDTMNGNCTLIPGPVAQAIGNLDKSFHHNLGDVDYGLRAKAQGFAIYMASGFVGECRDNTDAGTWRDRNAGFRRRWSHLNSPKGCPWPEWRLFAKRHLGPLWFLYAVSPFTRVILQSALRGRLREVREPGEG